MMKMKMKHGYGNLPLGLLFKLILLIFSVEISYGIHPDSDSCNGSGSSSGSGIPCICTGSGNDCFNPFAKGCLITVAEERGELDILSQKLGKRFRHLERVCNSNDDIDVEGRDDSDCVEEPGHQYSEIRIAPGNWDSSILLSWILQILLSELLRVPATLEFGYNGEKHEHSMGSFYDKQSRYVFPEISYGWNWLKEANINDGMCSETKKPCAHIIPEVWSGMNGMADSYTMLPRKNGLTGRAGYYIPKFTADEHPELMSHFGLRNQPQKMAEIFKTPINWGEYCDLNLNCTYADKVATRKPTDAERGKYFLDGSYTGFFKDNDCDVNNSTSCVGHFVDVYCLWTTLAESQFYWHNISLVSGGHLEPNNAYSNEELVEIVFAANATRSNVLFYWFEPDLFVASFDGTPMEFQRVKLPSPSLECMQYRDENRKYWSEIQCSAGAPEKRRIPAAGSCDYPSRELEFVFSKGLDIATQLSREHFLLKNPALDFLQSFQLRALSMVYLMRNIFSKSSGEFKYIPGGDHENMGYASRRAVCEWVYDNIDGLVHNIPDEYPRFFKEDVWSNPLRQLALGIGILAIVLVAVTAILTLKLKIKETIQLLGVNCWIWILSGFALIGVSSLLLVNDYCTLSLWFLVLGNTLELTPVLIKVWTINKMFRYTRAHQRANVRPGHLDAILLGALFVACTIMVAGELFDPYTKELRPALVPNDLHTVLVRRVHIAKYDITVNSHTVVWFLMLFLATVLTFQSRPVFEEFNESKGLAFLIYSHFAFLLLRILFETIAKRWTSNTFSVNINLLHSLLLSLDTIFALVFYFGQKFLVALKPQKNVKVSKLKSAFESAKEREQAKEHTDGDGSKTMKPEKQFSIHLKEMAPISAISEWGPQR